MLSLLVSQGLKTAIIEGDVVGGTCVNRGCVPSKALLAVSGRMRELHDEHHLKSLGLKVLSLHHACSFTFLIRGHFMNNMRS